MGKTGLDQPIHQPGYRMLAQPSPEALEILPVFNHELVDPEPPLCWRSSSGT